MKRGDTIIIAKISRLSRTPSDLIVIIGKCQNKSINFYTTKENYCFDNSIGSKVLLVWLRN